MTPEQAQGMLDYYDKMRGFDLTWEEIAAVLKQVANMRYEYAVQVEERPGVWRYLHSSGESTGFSIAACWCKNFEMAPYPLAKYRHRETTPSRIVRRLVSDPEVTE